MFLHGSHCLCIPATDKLRKKITTKNASNLGRKSERCLFPQECPEKRAMVEYLLCGTRLQKSYKIAVSSAILRFFKKLRSLSYNVASDFNAKKYWPRFRIPWDSIYHGADIMCRCSFQIWNESTTRRHLYFVQLWKRHTLFGIHVAKREILILMPWPRQIKRIGSQVLQCKVIIATWRKRCDTFSYISIPGS